jgi:urease accessory protein
LCFGRRASKERWQRGGLRLCSTVSRAGAPLWLERARVAAGSGFETSPIGLAGYSVSATLLYAGSDIEAALLKECRGIGPRTTDSRAGVTSLPGVLLARYLGHSSEEAMQWFTSLWQLLRPALLGVTATAPRLWAC